MPTHPTVYVVDDDEEACDSVCALASSMKLRAEPFASAEDFLDRYVPGKSGCLVTDVRMPGMSGLELQEELLRRGLRLPVIIFTAYAATPITVQAMKAGAVTLLEKPCVNDELGDAICRALAQNAMQEGEQKRLAQLHTRIAQLTPVERQVMDMIFQGLPNKRIALELDISLRAVERYRHTVFGKLQVSTTVELVRAVVEANEAA